MMLPIRRIASRAVAAAAGSPFATAAGASVLSSPIQAAAACRIAAAVAVRSQQQPRRAFSQTRTKLFQEQEDDRFGPPAHQGGDGDPGGDGSGGDFNPAERARYSAIDKKRSIFVGNVALELTPADMREIFTEYGPVTEVVKGVGGAHWFVYFPTEEDATKAMEASNGIFVRGRQMRVQPRLAPTSPRSFAPMRTSDSLKEPTPTVFIGNMPYNMTDQDLNELSKRLEYCFDIRVAIDRHTGWPRGYAHADFYTTGLAERAVAKLLAANVKMGANLLRIDYAATPRHASNAFNASRLRALRASGKTLEDYEELTEKLKREERGH